VYARRFCTHRAHTINYGPSAPRKGRFLPRLGSAPAEPFFWAGFDKKRPRHEGVTWAGLPANLIGGTGDAGNYGSGFGSRGQLISLMRPYPRRAHQATVSASVNTTKAVGQMRRRNDGDRAVGTDIGLDTMVERKVIVPALVSPIPMVSRTSSVQCTIAKIWTNDV